MACSLATFFISGQIAAAEAVVEKWGPDKAKWPGNLRTPFRDQGEKKYEGYVPGSIFVTAAAVNPTNTIQALALYIADTIKQKLANLFD